MNFQETWPILPAVLFIALCSAWVSAVETALGSLSPGLRRMLKKKNHRAFQAFNALQQNPERTSRSLLIASASCNSLLFFTCFLFLEVGFPGATIPGWSGLLMLFLFLIFFCELLPKLVSLGRPVVVLEHLLLPLAAVLPIFQVAAAWIEKLAGAASTLFPNARSREEVREEARLEYLSLLDLAGSEKSLTEFEGEVLREVVKLGLEPVTHCMTPRVDVFFLPDDTPPADALEVLRIQKYRRVPVHGETRDDILGILDVQQALLVPERSLFECLHPPAFLPDTMNSLDLLHGFLVKNQHFAIILDEYRGLEGIITLSDLEEELFGSEGPDSESGLYLESLGPDRCLASGTARLDDLAELLLWEDLNTSADTLGGLIAEIHGSIPKAGTVIPLGEWKAVVRRASRKRIREVLLERANIGPTTEPMS